MRVLELHPPTTGGDTAPLAAAVSSLGLLVGAPVSGVVTFESTAADVDPTPDHARFQWAIQDFEFELGSWSPSFGSTPGDIYLATFPTVPGSDLWVYAIAPLDPMATFTRVSASLELSSQDAAFFSPAALPTDPPALAQIDPFGEDPATLFGYGSDFLLTGRGPLGDFVLRAELTSLERVPEPSVLAELVLAAVILVARGGSPLEYLRRR